MLRVLQAGGVSTNSYLRRFHNFALALNWLPWPVLPKAQWPVVRHRPRRAVTRVEHERIVEREPNAERRAFYECCWHLGGAQSDVARLRAEDIDWGASVLSFFRAKTGVAQIVHFGASLAAVLRSLPAHGPLFPRLEQLDEKHRASLFQCICRRLNIKGISLHSYRYAWAERARACGYPERFAQEALGHNSKAVHRAYARHAQVQVPSLEDYERNAAAGKIVALPYPAVMPSPPPCPGSPALTASTLPASAPPGSTEPPPAASTAEGA